MGSRISRLVRKVPPRHLPSPSIASSSVVSSSIDSFSDLSMMAHVPVRGASPVTPQDIIFSCCICQATLSEVYDERDQYIGLHHEPGQPTGRITKLYLTECAHVVCAKHLEGGGKCRRDSIAIAETKSKPTYQGAPFYPQNQLPKAACPHCKTIKGDETPQVLFAINGRGSQDHSPYIPQAYFDTPPPGLKEPGTETAATRVSSHPVLLVSVI